MTTHTICFAVFLEFPRTPVSMCGAGLLALFVAVWAARSDLVQASGLEKIVALCNLCFAIPLAVFGALHLAAVDFVLPGVPAYMPWRLFWAYFVGCALLAASLSIAIKIGVRWSGLLFGMMMFLFAVALDIPGAVANPHDRFGWTLAVRELAFAGGGWLLAASTMRNRGANLLITVGRLLVAIAAIFYGVETMLHPLGCPGVPLQKLMPGWIPGRLLIGYLTGAILLAAGASMLLARKTRLAATCLGTWIVLLVVIVYGPILIAALADPNTGVKIEGINYFADTLLFGAAVLALAKATPRTE